MTFRSRIRPRRAFVSGLLALGLAGAAHAQLAVTVTPTAADDDDPSCHMFGTVATQKIEVTNNGAQAVTATLQCSVPSGLLRVSGVDMARSVAAGATETMGCGLYDFQDPPAAGASVTDFTVDVNGATSTHTVNVQCRTQPAPINRCAALKIQTSGQAGTAYYAALARYLKTGRSEPYAAALARARQRLERGFARANARYGAACRATDDVGTVRTALDGSLAEIAETAAAGGATSRCDAGRIQAAKAWNSRSMRAWSRNQRNGDTSRLVRTLVRVDDRFWKRWDDIGRRPGAACTIINPIYLRNAVDRPIHAVLDSQGAQRPNPEQWQAGLAR
jgi:hypothetical protein